MQPLRAILDWSMVTNGGQFIPEDGVCEGCDKLKRNHPGVEYVLAVRRIKYFDAAKGKAVYVAPVPYCLCPAVNGTQSEPDEQEVNSEQLRF